MNLSCWAGEIFIGAEELADSTLARKCKHARTTRLSCIDLAVVMQPLRRLEIEWEDARVVSAAKLQKAFNTVSSHLSAVSAQSKIL